MLCRLAHPTSGHASVAGFDVVARAKSVRRHIGLVFQEQTLDDQPTVGDVVGVPAAEHGLIVPAESG